MNELTVFQFEASAKVRTLEIDGVPWFVAKDVCDILGLDNVTEALRNHPENEKMHLKYEDFGNLNLSNTEVQVEHGGARWVNIVNEPGLYRLIFQSRKPEAEAFKTWVFTEVLPQIRKTGQFVVKELQEKLERMRLDNRSISGILHQDINYRLELLNLLDGLERVFIEGKGLKKAEYYKITHSFIKGKPVSAADCERLRGALGCDISDVLEIARKYHRTI